MFLCGSWRGGRKWYFLSEISVCAWGQIIPKGKTSFKVIDKFQAGKVCWVKRQETYEGTTIYDPTSLHHHRDQEYMNIWAPKLLLTIKCRDHSISILRNWETESKTIRQTTFASFGMYLHLFLKSVSRDFLKIFVFDSSRNRLCW